MLNIWKNNFFKVLQRILKLREILSQHEIEFSNASKRFLGS